MIMNRCPIARVRAWRSGLCAMLSVAALASGFTVFSSVIVSSPAYAKTPGSTYCYYGKCHRVKTLPETESLIGIKQMVQASFYDSCKVDSYNPCGLTSSGEQFRPEAADNAASPIYPDGTVVLVWSPVSQEAAVLRINNAGPYWGGRTLDVSRGAAEALGFRGQGVANLEVRVLEAPDSDEATYKRNRSYEPVLGPVGKYASIDEAQLSLAVVKALDAMPATAIVAQATTDLSRSLGNSALKIDVPGHLLASSQRAKPSGKVATRVAAVVKRPAAKRRVVAKRYSSRRSVAALRRGNRVVRYAQHRRPGISRRVARSRSHTAPRYAQRKWRSKPVVTRSSKRYRRIAEAHDLGRSHFGLPPLGGLRGIPVDDGPRSGAQPLQSPRGGSVLVA